MKEKMIHRSYSQLADFLRLGPTPASSDEVGCSAVNRRVASSNLARGANSLFNQPVSEGSLWLLSQRSKNVVRVLELSTSNPNTKRAKIHCFLRKPFVERPNPSVRNRMVGYFFNRLKYRDLICFGCPAAIAAWILPNLR
jgi:hypothetical protein